jgi:hypothetical protein
MAQMSSKSSPAQSEQIAARLKKTEAGLGVARAEQAAAVLCQEDARASCCMRDEGRPFGAAL